MQVLLRDVKFWKQSKMTISVCPTAVLTWCSSKTLDRWAGRVFRSSSYGHPVDVPRRSCLTGLHHRSYWMLRDPHWVTRLLGAGRLPWWRDIDCACVRLHRLNGVIVWLPGTGRQRRDDERAVDSGPAGIWQRRRSLWSRSYTFQKKKKRDGVIGANVSGPFHFVEDFIQKNARRASVKPLLEFTASLSTELESWS